MCWLLRSTTSASYICFLSKRSPRSSWPLEQWTHHALRLYFTLGEASGSCFVSGMPLTPCRRKSSRGKHLNMFPFSKKSLVFFFNRSIVDTHRYLSFECTTWWFPISIRYAAPTTDVTTVCHLTRLECHWPYSLCYGFHPGHVSCSFESLILRMWEWLTISLAWHSGFYWETGLGQNGEKTSLDHGVIDVLSWKILCYGGSSVCLL